MKYNCTNCNYSTDHCSNWTRHQKSDSHLKKVQQSNNQIKRNGDNIDPSQLPGQLTGQLTGQLPGYVAGYVAGHVADTTNKPKFSCPYCDQLFSSNQSLSRHKNHRCSKNNIDNKKDSNISKKELLKENEELKKNNEFLKSTVEKTNDITSAAITTAKKSISTLNFIAQNFTSAPALKPMDDFVIEEYCDKHGGLANVISLHKDNRIIEFLGNMIVDYYKKEDPEDQSVWNSDVYRRNYVVRIPTSKKTLKWLPDKKGIELTERVINPLLSHFDKAISKLMNDILHKSRDNVLAGKLKNNNKDDFAIFSASTNLTNDIKNSTIRDELVKFLAPHFHISRNEIESKKLIHPNLESNANFDEDSDCNPYSDSDSDTDSKQTKRKLIKN